MVERPLRQQKGNKQMSKRKPPPPYRFSTKKPINALAARVLPKHRYRSRPTGNISLRRAERMIALAEAAGMKKNGARPQDRPRLRAAAASSRPQSTA
jgi:hypothetical protein